MASVIGPSVEDMESLPTYEFLDGDGSGAVIRASVGYAAMDHHAATGVAGLPGGSSTFRGPYDRSLAGFWARVPFQGTLLLTMGDLLENHDSLMQFVQTGFEEEYLTPSRQHLEVQASNSVLKDLMSRATLIHKKVVGQPLLCRTADATLANVVHGQPLMHNCNAVIMVALELQMLHLVPVDLKERQAWIHGLRNCESLYVKGHFTASAQQMRIMCATFPASFEAELLHLLDPPLRKYVIIPRLITHVVALYYGRDTNSTQDQLAHGVLALVAGLLVTDMSAWFGGKEPTKADDHRLATDSNYYHDFMGVTPQLHVHLAARGVLMRWLLEEDFEAGFKDDHAAIEKLRTAASLGPQIELQDRMQTRRKLVTTATSVRSRHRSFTAPHRTCVLVHRCCREMLTQVRVKSKDQYDEVHRAGYPTNSLPISPFAWRRYLRDMPREQMELVWCLNRRLDDPTDQGDLLFQIGRRASVLSQRIAAGGIPWRYCVCGEHICSCDGQRPQDLLLICCCDKACEMAVREVQACPSITLAQYYDQLEAARDEAARGGEATAEAARRLMRRWIQVGRLNRKRLAQAEAKLATCLEKRDSSPPIIRSTTHHHQSITSNLTPSHTFPFPPTPPSSPFPSPSPPSRPSHPIPFHPLSDPSH
jgi:hypothetical protein